MACPPAAISKHTLDGCEIHFAPWLKPPFAGIYVGESAETGLSERCEVDDSRHHPQYPQGHLRKALKWVAKENGDEVAFPSPDRVARRGGRDPPKTELVESKTGNMGTKKSGIPEGSGGGGGLILLSLVHPDIGVLGQFGWQTGADLFSKRAPRLAVCQPNLETDCCLDGDLREAKRSL